MTSKNGKITITEARIRGDNFTTLVFSDDRDLSDLLNMFKNSQYFRDYLDAKINFNFESRINLDVSLVLSNEVIMKGTFILNRGNFDQWFFRENLTDDHDGYLMEVPSEISRRVKNAFDLKKPPGGDRPSSSQINLKIP